MTPSGDLLSPVPPAYGGASLTGVLPGVIAALVGPSAGPPADPLGGPADLLGGSADPLGGSADLFGGSAGPLRGVRRAAVLLVDGLGWHQLALASRYAPTLAELVAGRLGASRPAMAGRLTAGFPSTTPTSLVSLGTGAAPGAHGVLGFTLRVPGTDRVLNHIRWTDDPDPRGWQPLRTQLDRAAAAGVTVSVTGRPEFAGSGLTVAAYGGQPYRGARTVDETASGMLAALVHAPALAYGYHPDIDRAGHASGVDSPAWRAAVVEADRLVTRLVDELPRDAALVVTADHGMIDVPEAARFDCGADPGLRSGVTVVAGEPRVRYLHTLPGAAADVADAWRSVLGDAALVLSREEAVATGWFGPVSEAHLQRIGDVVAVCRGRAVVLASATEPTSVSKLVGFHGSTTAAEMEIPLLVIGPATG